MSSTDAFLIGTGYLSSNPGNSGLISIPLVDAGTIEIGWLSRQNHVFSETAEKFIALVKAMCCYSSPRKENQGLC